MKTFIFTILALFSTVSYAWDATLTIHNNTDYNITINRNTVGDIATVVPGQSYSYTTNDPNTTNSLRFWKTPNVWFMQGSASYGPNAGVWVDRGWMDPNSQTIKMTANANGTIWTQTTNGGKEILAWNQFQQGGEIVLEFDNQ